MAAVEWPLGHEAGAIWPVPSQSANRLVGQRRLEELVVTLAPTRITTTAAATR